MNYGYHKGQWMGIATASGSSMTLSRSLPKGIEIDYAKRGFDLAHRPASLQKKPPAASGTTLVRRCLGAGYLLPYFLFCRRCNLYSKKNHCAVDEDYFHYLQRKADLQSQTGKSACLARCSDKIPHSILLCGIFNRLPVIDRQCRQTVEGPVGQVAVLLLVVALGGDHGAVIAAVFQLGQIDFCAQLLGTIVHQLAQTTVGGYAAR